MLQLVLLLLTVALIAVVVVATYHFCKVIPHTTIRDLCDSCCANDVDPSDLTAVCPKCIRANTAHLENQSHFLSALGFSNSPTAFFVPQLDGAEGRSPNAQLIREWKQVRAQVRMMAQRFNLALFKGMVVVLNVLGVGAVALIGQLYYSV